MVSAMTAASAPRSAARRWAAWCSWRPLRDRARLADVVAQHVDVSDAHREHQITWTRDCGDAARRVGVMRLVDNLLGRQRDAITDRRAGHARDRFLAGRE